MSFGSKLAEYRKSRGIDQKAFAKRVGIAITHLNRIEREINKPPKIETIFQMIEKLCLTRIQAIALLQEAGYPMELFNGSTALDKLERKSLAEKLEAIQAEIDEVKRQLVDESP